jgi:hypothetical protein
MSDQVSSIIEPFVRRGLFASQEEAVTEMARDYVLRQIERYQSIVARLHAKYGMSYEQFMLYSRSRAATLVAHPDPTLSRAMMVEEEDALDWKMAHEMLQRWLGLQVEKTS